MSSVAVCNCPQNTRDPANEFQTVRPYDVHAIDG